MKSKNKRRVPWHITLFSGGSFFLILSLREPVSLDGVLLAVLFFGLGAWYVIAGRKPGNLDDPQDPGENQNK